jgi:hypothetical protein
LKKDEFNTYEGLSNADVAIDFSIPSVAVDNISSCFHAGVPVISGTTGWLEHYNEMVALCAEKKGAFISSSNFSLGVNLFFELNEYLAKMMAMEQKSIFRPNFGLDSIYKNSLLKVKPSLVVYQLITLLLLQLLILTLQLLKHIMPC